MDVKRYPYRIDTLQQFVVSVIRGLVLSVSIVLYHQNQGSDRNQGSTRTEILHTICAFKCNTPHSCPSCPSLSFSKTSLASPTFPSLYKAYAFSNGLSSEGVRDWWAGLEMSESA
jgi:hypothetical protein